MGIVWVMSEEDTKNNFSWETLCKASTGFAIAKSFHSEKHIFLETQRIRIYTWL